MKPEISVIIPMYNVEAFLHRSLQSCVDQDYEGTFEVVLVDDGSTDKTLEIAKQFVRENSKSSIHFSLHSQPNQGASAARNKGVSFSRAENILFLDADDYLEPGAVREALLALCSKDSIGLVYSDHRKVLPSGEVFKERVKEDFSLPHLLTGMYLGHLRAMPKKVFEEMGGFDEELTHAEDYDLVLRIATEGYEIKHVHKILYNYVFNETSLACGDEGFENIVKGGQEAIRRAFRRLGLKGDIAFGKPWKTQDTVTRYFTKDQVAFYLEQSGGLER